MKNIKNYNNSHFRKTLTLSFIKTKRIVWNLTFLKSDLPRADLVLIIFIVQQIKENKWESFPNVKAKQSGMEENK